MTCVTHHRISYFSREEIFLSFFSLLFRRNIWKMEKVFFFFLLFHIRIFLSYNKRSMQSNVCVKLKQLFWISLHFSPYHSFSIKNLYQHLGNLFWFGFSMANSNVLIAFVIIISCKLKKLFLNKSSLENYEGKEYLQYQYL